MVLRSLVLLLLAPTVVHAQPEFARPAARSDPPVSVIVPGLAASEEAHQRTLEMPLEDVGGILAAIQQTRDLYLRQATTPVMMVMAYTRIADLIDYWASRLWGLPSGRARAMFCLSRYYYLEAIERDPSTVRATEQLAAYGDVFAAGCTRDPPSLRTFGESASSPSPGPR